MQKIACRWPETGAIKLSNQAVLDPSVLVLGKLCSVEATGNSPVLFTLHHTRSPYWLQSLVGLQWSYFLAYL